MEKIVINGQFFLQPNTGQQRYAKGILAELDKIIDKNEITIVVPKKAINIIHYYYGFDFICTGLTTRLFIDTNLMALQ